MNGSAVVSHARVVVIGGGIAGISTLYHLTREGWSDVVLVERDELTSGSTWHAAAQVTQFGSNQTMLALKRHSIDLYRELAADPDFPINYHITGGMRLAHTRDQLDTYRHYTGVAAGVGVEMEVIDAAEAGRRHPLLQTDGLLGAWWDPLDGDIDPAQLVFALARRARKAGAKVYRFNPVQGITRKPDGEFIVHTEHGAITCEMVVNATGYRVNEVGAMLGVVHPVTSMEHMYFLTEEIAAIQALDHRVPIIRDPGDDFYSRQEKNGLLVGVYEQACKPFGMDGIDPHFTKALCPSDLDRCLDNMEEIFKRLPCLTETGIHTVINGPITYTIDGAPLVGPIPGIRNAFACLGLRAGIGEGGGLGKVLAEIMVHGTCEWDAWYLDPRRFTSYATTSLTCVKAIEDYQNEFHYPLPHEQRPAGRLARTTPLYGELDALGAAWGVVNGWERVLFFKPTENFDDTPGFRFTPAHPLVGRETERLAAGVGLMEVSGFNRYEISGPDAEEYLDQMCCSRIPHEIGRVRLCYLLNDDGNVVAEATIAKLGADRFWYGSAAAAEWHDRDWLMAHVSTSQVEITELADTWTTMVVAGPDSRRLLDAVAPLTDWTNNAFGPMQLRTVLVGISQVHAIRVSFSGELAFELHVPNASLVRVWRTLWENGQRFDIQPFGLYATESMRLEKGYRHWKTDLLTEFHPMECGLDRFVDPGKSFHGKEGLLSAIENGPRKLFVSMIVGSEHAPAHSGDPIYYQGAQVGSVTSAGFGHRTGRNIAMGFVDPEHAVVGTAVEIGILGERHGADIVAPVIYDPDNLRVRS